MTNPAEYFQTMPAMTDLDRMTLAALLINASHTTFHNLDHFFDTLSAESHDDVIFVAKREERIIDDEDSND